MAGILRLLGGQVQRQERIAHALIVGGIEFQQPLENAGGLRQLSRFHQQFTEMLLGPHVGPRGYGSPEVAHVLLEKCLAQVMLRSFDNLPH